MRVRQALHVTLFGAMVSILSTSCGADPRDEAPPTASGSAAEVIPTGGLRRGMKRYRDPTRKTDVTPSCNSPQLSYFGGPVIQNPIVVPVFWNSNVNAEVQQNMEQFYADIMASSYWGWLHEYDTMDVSGGTGQVILPGTAQAGVVISPSHCPASSTSSCKLTDAQIQAELTAQIGAGKLPAPQVDCTGSSRTIYMVDFPHNVSVSGPQGSGSSCQQFCAYHNTGTYGPSNIALLYGVLMDQYTGACATGCGGNATPLEDMTTTASHELIEAVTDPDIGLIPASATSIQAPAGWYDPNNMCGEIGDICDNGGAGDTITVSGRTWTVQETWSNKQNKCTSTGTAPPVCSGTNLTGCRKCNCGDSGVDCTGATPYCETSSANVLAGACEACTAADACTGGKTCQQSATPSQDDVCVGGCTPAKACPAGQSCGTAPDGCGGTLSCGTCTAPQTCSGTVCVGGSTSTSSSTGSSSGAGGSTGSTGGSTGSSSGAGAAGTTSGTGASFVRFPAQPSGCGCKTAGEPGGTSGASLAALGLLALAGLTRSRRRQT